MTRRRPDDTIDVRPSDGDGYTKREVPGEVGEAVLALAGEEGRPETLGELMRVVDTDVFSPGALDEEAMLVTDDDSRHEVHLGQRSVNTYCILDALVLAFLEDGPVEIETREPGSEEPISFTASHEGLVGVDEAMVVSFGFSTDLSTDPSTYEDEQPGEVQETIHELGCPKINLFEDRAAYEAWADGAEAVTMPIPLPEALALARDTVRTWDESA